MRNVVVFVLISIAVAMNGPAAASSLFKPKATDHETTEVGLASIATSSASTEPTCSVVSFSLPARSFDRHAEARVVAPRPTARHQTLQSQHVLLRN